MPLRNSLDRLGPCELVLSSYAAKEVLISEDLMWYVYIIEKNARYYTGITTDLKNRLHQHGNPPLLYKESFPDKFLAVRREKQIKEFSRAKKQALIAKFRT